MSDFEARLRAALASVSEQVPPGLIQAVARRHRRHQIRLGASLLAVAAAAALAVPAVAGALAPQASTGPGISPGLRHQQHRQHQLAASRGTELAGCGGADAGRVGPHWHANGMTGAGPLWFNDGGHSHGPLRLYVSIAFLKLRPGARVVVRVAPAGRGYLRFLYGPREDMTAGRHYTMRSGESGVTFVGCARGIGLGAPAGITDYYGGFLVKGARCVPVDAWFPGRARPVRLHLGACARN